MPTITDKDTALSVMWEYKDGLLPIDIAREIAECFRYPRENLDRLYKSVERLRAEGIWLESPAPSLDPGQGAVFQSTLPEGVLCCDLAESVSGIGSPKIFPGYSSARKICAWRTERALAEGFRYNPNKPGKLYFT